MQFLENQSERSREKLKGLSHCVDDRLDVGSKYCRICDIIPGELQDSRNSISVASGDADMFPTQQYKSLRYAAVRKSLSRGNADAPAVRQARPEIVPWGLPNFVAYATKFGRRWDRTRECQFFDRAQGGTYGCAFRVSGFLAC